MERVLITSTSRMILLASPIGKDSVLLEWFWRGGGTWRPRWRWWLKVLQGLRRLIGSPEIGLGWTAGAMVLDRQQLAALVAVVPELPPAEMQ